MSPTTGPESGADIFDVLVDEPAVPSGLRAEDVLTAGRARARARRLTVSTAMAGVAVLAISGAAVLAVQGLPGADRSDPAATGGSTGSGPGGGNAAAVPPGPTRCAIQRLPLPDDRSMALVTGGDPSGRFLLGRTYPKQSSGDSMGLHLVIWDRLHPTLVTMPGDDQSLQDVNTAGVAVGNGYGKAGTVAYVYRAGTVTKLPGGDGAEVLAINDAGTAVGGRGEKPVRWRSVDQAPEQLAMPAGATQGGAVDIDEDGTVIGLVGTGPADQRPYLWAPDGGGRELAIPSGIPAAPEVTKSGRPTSARSVGEAGAAAGAPGAKRVMVYGVRNGWVIGRVNTTAVRWNLRTGQTEQFAVFGGSAEAVNGHGWQVGLDAQSRALLVAGPTPVALPELAAHKPGTLNNIPTTINDDGTVVGGQSDDSNDVIHAVVWTCS